MIINSPWKAIEAFVASNSKSPSYVTVLEVYKNFFSHPFYLQKVDKDGTQSLTTKYEIEKSDKEEKTLLISFKSWVYTRVTETQKLVTMLGEEIQAKDCKAWDKLARFAKWNFIYDEILKIEPPMVDYYTDHKYAIKSTDAKSHTWIVGYDDVLWAL